MGNCVRAFIVFICANEKKCMTRPRRPNDSNNDVSLRPMAKMRAHRKIHLSHLLVCDVCLLSSLFDRLVRCNLQLAISPNQLGTNRFCALLFFLSFYII